MRKVQNRPTLLYSIGSKWGKSGAWEQRGLLVNQRKNQSIRQDVDGKETVYRR